jgi:hypothetical protein
MKNEQRIALYDNHDDAAEAIHALLKAGVSKEKISTIEKTEIKRS